MFDELGQLEVNVPHQQRHAVCGLQMGAEGYVYCIVQSDASYLLLACVLDNFPLKLQRPLCRYSTSTYEYTV